MTGKTEQLFAVLCKSALTKSIHYNAIVYGILAKLMFIHCNNTDMTRSWVDQLPTKRLRELAAERLKLERSCGRMILSPYLQSLMSLNLAIGEASIHIPSAESKANVTSTREQVNSFKFDRMYCGPSIDISNNGLNAAFSSSESWSTVLGNVGFMTGKNHWKIRVERSPTAYLFVGVATKDANLSTFLGGDENGWGYIGDRALYHKRNKVKLYGERFGQGDVIGVTLDMDEGTLSFDKNGEKLGVAITNLVGVIYPAVAFYNRGQQVRILSEHFDLPGAGVDVPGSPSSVNLDDIIKSSIALRSYGLNKCFSEKFILDVYQNTYRKWYMNETMRYLTQSGYELQLDRSNELCLNKYGLSIGEQVPTMRGLATVVGIGPNGKLWRSIEGEESSEKGVWFFSERELQECKLNRNPSRQTQNAESKVDTNSVTVNKEGSSCNYDGVELTEMDGLPCLTLNEFKTLLQRNINYKELDIMLIQEINWYCKHLNNASVNKDDLSPWNITPKILRDKLLPRVAKRINANAHKRRSIPELFRQHRAEDVDPKEFLSFKNISARYALLSYINDKLVGLLPFSSMAGVYDKPMLATVTYCPTNMLYPIMYMIVSEA